MIQYWPGSFEDDSNYLFASKFGFPACAADINIYNICTKKPFFSCIFNIQPFFVFHATHLRPRPA
jgi:hypothetical protein